MYLSLVPLLHNVHIAITCISRALTKQGLGKAASSWVDAWLAIALVA
jgi:hypothetical protein